MSEKKHAVKYNASVNNFWNYKNQHNRVYFIEHQFLTFTILSLKYRYELLQWKKIDFT